MSDHLSRKDLKQDKIHDALEHGAEAVYTHKQATSIVLVVVLVIAAAYGGWSIYHERQTAAASAAFDTAMKAYTGHIGTSPDPAEAVMRSLLRRLPEVGLSPESEAVILDRTGEYKLERLPAVSWYFLPGWVRRGPQAADPGQLIPLLAIEFADGNLQGSRAGIGEFLVLAKPRLKAGHAQRQARVVGPSD